jgi:DNA-binding IclR family transcriptional regulator
MIYFLVDGQRSVADLARHSGKTVAEVESILQELQEWNLIVFSSPER